jgi:hypothetical protein
MAITVIFGEMTGPLTYKSLDGVTLHIFTVFTVLLTYGVITLLYLNVGSGIKERGSVV